MKKLTVLHVKEAILKHNFEIGEATNYGYSIEQPLWKLEVTNRSLQAFRFTKTGLVNSC